MAKQSKTQSAVQALIENANRQNAAQTIDALVALGKPAAECIFNKVDDNYGLRQEILVRALARLDITLATRHINWMLDMDYPRKVLVGIVLARDYKLDCFSDRLGYVILDSNKPLRLRLMAADALGSMGSPLSIAKLFELGNAEIAFETKTRAWHWIDHALPIKYDEIKSRLGSGSHHERAKMAKYMESLGPNAIPFLAHFIQHGTTLTRESAQKSLESVSDPASIPALVRLLTMESNPPARLLVSESAIVALNRFGELAIPALQKRFNANLEGALSALSAYEKMDTPLATEEIINALKINFFNVRITAIRALCKKGAKTIHIVVNALDDPNNEVSNAALDGLCYNGYALLALVHFRDKARNDFANRNKYVALMQRAAKWVDLLDKKHSIKAIPIQIKLDTLGLKQFPTGNPRTHVHQGAPLRQKQLVLQ